MNAASIPWDDQELVKGVLFFTAPRDSVVMLYAGPIHFSVSTAMVTFPAGHALGFRDDRLEFVSIGVALEVQEVTKMYDELELEFQNSDSTGDGDHESIDETRCHTVEQFFNASDDQYRPDRHQIRAFLVACHLAAVSVETMSRQLGFDKETIRRELIFGLKAWTAAQRRSGEALHAEDLGYFSRDN